MNVSTGFRRRAFLALAGGVALAAANIAPASASQATEAYVQTNAQTVLTNLAQAKSAAQRQTEFSALMDKFADMPRVADYVLGKYARQARANPAQYKVWQDTFKQYGLAVYESQLDQYRGRTIKVLAGQSEDSTINGREYSVVKSQIVLPTGQPFLVNWRLLKTGESWRVVDVALKLDETVIWLAIQQQQDFLARLDKNGGDIAKLTTVVQQLTADMRKQISARG
jgi:phospholipid transport system substrate-binding protein